MTDPISDMLARIRNAALARKAAVLVPYSRTKAKLAEILVREGYLTSVEEEASPYRQLKLHLAYRGSQPIVRSLRRVSTPGRRAYVTHTDLPRVLSGLGVAIVSTSRGLMTNREAKEQRVGGEVICEVY